MPTRNHKPNLWQRIKNKFDGATEQIRFLKYERGFGERDSDIYIASFPRSGTTLLQVISYHLTHEGGMDYRHLDDVSPWLRNLSVKKLPLPQITGPRIIKTHDPYTLIPPDKKGKFIFIVRDAADVVVSNYYNWKNYNDADLQLDEVFDKLIDSDSATAYFHFNRAWLENKKKLPVLYLRYEDVIGNKREAINNIATFLNVMVSDTQLNDLLRLSSFDNMKLNERKFGEEPDEKLADRVYNQFIRYGKAGEGKLELSEEQVIRCNRIMKQLSVYFQY